MSPTVYLLAFVIIAIACTTQAAIGFGGNLVAMPAVALVEPDLVPASVLIAVTSQNVLMLIRDRQGLEFQAVSGALVGRLIGTVIAVAVLSSLSAEGLQIAVAVVVLMLVALTATTWTPVRTPATMLGAGTISGVFAGTAGIGGPPVALMFQNEPGHRIRGSMGGFFAVGTTITLVGLAVAGELGATELRDGILLLPAGVVGFFVSTPLLPVVDRGYTRPAIQTFCVLAAVLLIARTVV